MAIIVEDATGLSTSESYLSYADYVTYWSDRGVTISETEAQIEVQLRLTTEYIDLRWGDKVPGLTISETQSLSYPTDYFIVDPVALPVQLKRAMAEYLRYSLTNTLFINNTVINGPGIISLTETLGPLETKTVFSGSGDGSVGRKYPIVSKADVLMRQITFGSSNGGVIR
jgi:hypothetical protein